MRCTRCDKLAIPQVLGRDPLGRLIFGWCLECLKAEGCTEIELVKSIRQSRSFGAWMSRPLKERVAKPSATAGSGSAAINEGPVRPGTPGLDLLLVRQRYVLVVAALLGLWGLAFLAGALAWVLWPKPVEVGEGLPRTPFFLGLAGGSLLALSGFLLVAGLEATGRGEPIRKATRLVTPVLIAGILLYGIVYHSPRRDPWLVALAFVVLLLGGLAGREKRIRVES